MTGYGHTTITAVDTHGCQEQISIDTCLPIAIVPNSPRYQVGNYATFSTNDGISPYTWASSQPSVGTIDEDGHFSAVSRGQTTITVTDGHGCQGQTITTVCSGITITPSTSGYHTGHTFTLSAAGGELALFLGHQ